MPIIWHLLIMEKITQLIKRGRRKVRKKIVIDVIQLMLNYLTFDLDDLGKTSMEEKG